MRVFVLRLLLALKIIFGKLRITQILLLMKEENSIEEVDEILKKAKLSGAKIQKEPFYYDLNTSFIIGILC